MQPTWSFFADHLTPTPWGQMYSRENLSLSEVHVVLVTGMIVSSSYMMPLARELGRFCQVHVVDFPGYGKSAKPKHVLNISELAETLLLWMDLKKLKKADFVASSFGCQILAEFAQRHSDKVNRLVMQGPTVDPSARSVWQQMWRLKRNSRREKKSVGMISFRDYRSAGIKRVWRTIKLTLNDRIEDKLPHIDAPTLVIRGSRDPVVPQDWAERITKLLPHGKLIVIDQGAHSVNYSEAQKLAEVILPFLGISLDKHYGI